MQPKSNIPAVPTPAAAVSIPAIEQEAQAAMEAARVAHQVAAKTLEAAEGEQRRLQRVHGNLHARAAKLAADVESARATTLESLLAEKPDKAAWELWENAKREHRLTISAIEYFASIAGPAAERAVIVAHKGRLLAEADQVEALIETRTLERNRLLRPAVELEGVVVIDPNAGETGNLIRRAATLRAQTERADEAIQEHDHRQEQRRQQAALSMRRV